MRRMLLAVFAVAAFGLSAGVASADVVCSPVCGLVTAAEVNNQKSNNSSQGTATAAQNMSQQGADHNKAGIGQSGGTGDAGGTLVMF